MLKDKNQHKRLGLLFAGVAAALILASGQAAVAQGFSFSGEGHSRSTFDEAGFTASLPDDGDDGFGDMGFSFSGAAFKSEAKPVQSAPAPAPVIAYGPEADFIRVPRQDIVRMAQVIPAPRVMAQAPMLSGRAAVNKDPMRDRCTQVFMNSVRYTKRVFNQCRDYVNRAERSYAAGGLGD